MLEFSSTCLYYDLTDKTKRKKVNWTLSNAEMKISYLYLYLPVIATNYIEDLHICEVPVAYRLRLQTMNPQFFVANESYSSPGHFTYLYFAE